MSSLRRNMDQQETELFPFLEHLLEARGPSPTLPLEAQPDFFQIILGARTVLRRRQTWFV